jgi:uncharacterized membrane protein/nitrite reductase/ring-hydroxylating ferredoxin subunit
MKSKASIKSHPIHPILIPFPIVGFVGALLFDTLSFFTDNDTYSSTAQHLNVLGIGFALLAAVPGIIDYINTVPPKSSASKRAIKHGLSNITVVLLFSIVLWLRFKEVNMLLILCMEVVAVGLMMFAGWLGGTLVYRNQIGVDPRYANAGKWKEIRVAEAQSPFKVAAADELKLNQMKLVHVANRRIVIGRTENGYVAFDDRCTHRGGSLAGGAMICGTVQCPWHGSQFDVNSGAVKAGPAKESIRSYRVEDLNGNIFLQLDDNVRSTKKEQ